MSESTPTPTDPREGKNPKVFLVTMRERQNDGATETVSFRSGIYVSQSEAHAKVAMLESRQSGFAVDELDAKPFDTTFLTAQLESTNSKLAAEIAELKGKLATALEQRDTRSLTALERVFEIDTLRAELEAARKERDAAVEWKSNTERILADGHAVHLNMLRGTIATPTKAQLLQVLGDQSLYTAEKDRDTALAAKDAAERVGRTARKLLTNLRGALVDVLDHVKGNGPHPPALWRVEEMLTAALTPAPTQEPPAGGVTISTEKKGEQHARPETLAEETPLTNSPADAPSEGRGELLPFNLSDALAGKPVVTRKGKPITKIKEHGHSIFGEMDGVKHAWHKDGVYSRACESGWDLFMLPTEGSGA